MFALANGQPGQPQGNEQKHDWVGVLYWLCVIHSGCVLAFLRYRCGREAFGVRGMFSFLLLLACVGFESNSLGPDDTPLMGWWVIAFIAAVIVQRVITHRAINRGAVIHSLYAGTPLLMKLPLVRKERGTMILEMMLCFFMGVMFLAISQFMGLFMMLALFTLMTRTGIEETVWNRRLERMQDARIEGRYFSDRMR